MTRKDTAALYARIGLIIAAFALVMAIVGQPLWESLWPDRIEVTDNSLTRAH